MIDIFYDFMLFVLAKTKNGELLNDAQKAYFRDYLKKSSVANRFWFYSHFYRRFIDFSLKINIQFENLQSLKFGAKSDLLENNLFEINEANLDYCCEILKKNDGYTFSWLLDGGVIYQRLFAKNNIDLLVQYMLKRSSNCLHERNDVLLTVLFSPYLEGDLLECLLEAVDTRVIELAEIYSSLMINTGEWLSVRDKRGKILCEKLLASDKLAFSWNNLIIAYNFLNGNKAFVEFMIDSLKNGKEKFESSKFEKNINKDFLQNFVRFVFETSFVSISTYSAFVDYMSKNKQFVPDIMYDHYFNDGHAFNVDVIKFFDADKCYYVINLYLGASYRVYYKHSSMLCYLAKNHAAGVMKLLDEKLVHNNICICASLLYNLVDEKSGECIFDDVEFEYILRFIPAETIDDVFDVWKAVYDEGFASVLINRILGYSDILFEKMDSDSVENSIFWAHLIFSISKIVDEGVVKNYYSRMRKSFDPRINTSENVFSHRYRIFCSRIRRELAKLEENLPF